MLSKEDLPNSMSSEQLDKVLKEKLGIGFTECTEALSLALKESADELVVDIFNIAPYGDYTKIMEDKSKMAEFLREEAAKIENWEIEYLEIKNEKSELVEFLFRNEAVDDGDILKGFVFVGLNTGKIRHAFAQMS